MKLSEMQNAHEKIRLDLKERLNIYVKESSKLKEQISNYETFDEENKQSMNELLSYNQNLIQNNIINKGEQNNKTKELKNKIGIIEERIKVYKLKAQEIRNIKKKLQSIKDNIRNTQLEIEKIDHIIQDTTKKTAFFPSNEAIEKQQQILAEKNNELKRNLDFLTKHKETILLSIDKMNAKK